MTEKRTRRTRAELRELMITAGKEVLMSIPPTMGFEELTYSAVFEHLLAEHDQKVTIGSVHERIWGSQREFQLCVVAEVLRDPVEPATRQIGERGLATIAAFDTSTLEGRRNAMRSVARLNSYKVQAPPMSREIQIVHAVRFRLWLLGPDHPEAQGFAEAMTEIRTASAKAAGDALRSFMQVLDLRVKAEAGDPDAAIEMVAILANAAIIGVRTDAHPNSERARMLPTGPNGELEQWYPDGLAYWHTVRATLELNGDGLTDAQRQL